MKRPNSKTVTKKGEKHFIKTNSCKDGKWQFYEKDGTLKETKYFDHGMELKGDKKSAGIINHAKNRVSKMLFPFAIEFKKDLNVNENISSENRIFLIIETYLKSKSVNDQYRQDNTLKFSKWFGLRTNVFAFVDKGEFKLSVHNKQYKLSYRFYCLHSILIGLVMSIAFGLFSQSISLGLIAFAGLVILNFIINFLRQQGVINDIAIEIHENFKTESPGSR